LVIRYSYLWKRESDAGQEEGVKDRPCAVVLVVADAEGKPIVTVLPITHSQPAVPELAVEIPAVTKRRLGLDSERSWVLIDEANRFAWPGPDVRMVRNSGAYGVLPPRFFEVLKAKFLATAKAQRARVVHRSD
jgi:hypothetical protein